MTSDKRSILLVLIVGVAALTGCGSLGDLKMKLDPPVSVLAPASDATLIRGQPFTVNTIIDVDYEVGSVTFELWDVATGARHVWEREQMAPAKTIRLDETLEVPATLPVGDDYRFSVSALPAQGAGGASGYTVVVKVAPGP